MNDVRSSDYLETLPAHPRPQSLESLNSYLKRVACANGIHHVNTFSHLTGVREPRHWLELRPAPDYGQLGTVTCCSDRELLALTVYFLGRKFGREQSLGRFLAHSTASYQRWCPACLAEQGYAKLPWSFLHLSGCPQHGIRFAEVCPHCQRSVRLTSTSLSLHHCPHCAGDLRQSDGVKLTEAEREQCQHDWDDLAYLLTPQTWDVDEQSPVRAAFRQRLGFLRRASGVDAKRFARLLGLRPRILVALENETASGCGETFDDYLRYVQRLGWDLSDVFRDSAAAGYLHKDDLYAAELLRRTQAAIHQLKAAQVPVTQRQVGALLAYEPSALRNYPTIAACLHTEALVRKRRTADYEDDLYRQTQHVLHAFTTQGRRVSRRAVCFHLEQTPARIHKFYPRVDRLLDEAVQAQQQRHTKQKAALLHDVQVALAWFREQGQLVTQSGVADYLGVSADRLRRHASVRQLIAEQSALSEQVWLQVTTARISAALVQVEQQNGFLSQSELADQLGLSRDVFQQHPELRAMWQAFARRQYQRHETALLARVEAAIATCEAQHLPLTFRRIEALIGFPRAALKRYPRVLSLLQTHHLVRTKPDAPSVVP